MEHTILQVAQAIAEQHCQDESGVEYWHRVFRQLHAAGLLRSQGRRGHGRTAAALFDQTGLCHAALIGTLMANFGLEARTVREILQSITDLGQIPDERAPSQRQSHGFHGAGIAAAARGVAIGERWVFQVSVVRDGQYTDLSCRFLWADNPKPSKPIVDDRAFSKTQLGRIEVDLNAVFAPHVDRGAEN